MGCLYVNIVSPQPAVVQVVPNAVQADATATCKNAVLSAIAIASGIGTVVSVDGIGPDLAIDAQGRNTTPTVTVGLVCRVSITGGWYYLQVEEGNVITIDGQYMKVMRA